MKKEMIEKKDHSGPMRLMGPMGLMGLMGPMGPMGLMRPMRLMGLIGLMGLMGCSGEQIVGPEEGTKPEPVEKPEPEPEPVLEGIPLYLKGYVSPFGMVSGAMTRAFSFTGYEEPTEYVPIGAFFTNDMHANKVEKRRILRDNPTPSIDGKWYYTPPVEIESDNYQLYGYMPYNAADVTIEPNNTYEGGATLHFTGMNIITTKDICVMVGAKHGTDAETPVKDGEGQLLLKTGNFDCHMNNGEGQKNYLFLLFDHLYASISFRFRVEDTYARMRTIHLKKLELTAYYDKECNSPKIKEQDATVVLRKTTDGSSPIQSIEFTPTSGSAQVNNEKFFEGDVELNSVDWSETIAYVPYTESYYKLRSTYDVYDRKGNLIRHNCVAENTLNPFRIFNLNVTEMQRGKQYVLKLKIAPTYLYQLSDPDLDNPTITVTP